MEIQLVHIHEEYKNSESQGNLAILSVPVKLQKTANQELNHIFEAMSQLKSRDVSKMVTKARLSDFLPRNTDKFYRYEKIDTYSSCNGIVTWTIFKVSLKITSNSYFK